MFDTALIESAAHHGGVHSRAAKSLPLAIGFHAAVIGALVFSALASTAEPPEPVIPIAFPSFGGPPSSAAPGRNDADPRRASAQKRGRSGIAGSDSRRDSVDVADGGHGLDDGCGRGGSWLRTRRARRAAGRRTGWRAQQHGTWRRPGHRRAVDLRARRRRCDAPGNHRERGSGLSRSHAPRPRAGHRRPGGRDHGSRDGRRAPRRRVRRTHARRGGRGGGFAVALQARDAERPCGSGQTHRHRSLRL